MASFPNPDLDPLPAPPPDWEPDPTPIEGPDRASPRGCSKWYSLRSARRTRGTRSSRCPRTSRHCRRSDRLDEAGLKMCASQRNDTQRWYATRPREDVDRYTAPRELPRPAIGGVMMVFQYIPLLLEAKECLRLRRTRTPRIRPSHCGRKGASSTSSNLFSA